MKECKNCRSLYEDSLPVCPNCGENKSVTGRKKAEENDGLNHLPNSTKIDNVISNYETYAPVYLLKDIDYLFKSSYTECTQDVMTDNHGAEYSSIEFETRGEYKTFTGAAFLSYDDRGFSREVWVKI